VEANAVLAILRTLAESVEFFSKVNVDVQEGGFPIGVICMYAAQRDLIRHRFNQSDWAAPIRNFVKIGTVDSYQGKENRIILLSLVCNNDKDDIGFLGGSERINVAMSRAMDRLVIFGATAMWRDRRGTALHNVVAEVSKLHVEGKASLHGSKIIMGLKNDKN
jgi:superfamily I DNA and/or RNA helicase